MSGFPGPPHFLASALATAVERNALGYWAALRCHAWEQDDAGNLTGAKTDVKAGAGTCQTVDLSTISAGIAKVKDGGLYLRPDLHEALLPGDRGNYDSYIEWAVATLSCRPA